MNISFQHRISRHRRPRIHVLCEVETHQARPNRPRPARSGTGIQLKIALQDRQRVESVLRSNTLKASRSHSDLDHEAEAA